MAFLIVAGTTVEVQQASANETARVLVGERARAWAGNLRSTVRTVKREFTFATAPMTLAAANALRALVDNAAEVTVGGDAMLPSTTITALVEVRDANYIDDQPSFLQVLTLVVREV